MRIHSVKIFGETGIRLLLFLLAFTLPLIAYVANHVNSGFFVSIDVPEHHCHAGEHPVPGPIPAAELQEDEFDEALIPKAFHDLLPVFELLEPFRFERPVFRISRHSGLRLPECAPVSSLAPEVLRC